MQVGHKTIVYRIISFSSKFSACVFYIRSSGAFNKQTCSGFWGPLPLCPPPPPPSICHPKQKICYRARIIRFLDDTFAGKPDYYSACKDEKNVLRILGSTEVGHKKYVIWCVRSGVRSDGVSLLLFFSSMWDLGWSRGGCRKKICRYWEGPKNIYRSYSNVIRALIDLITGIDKKK